MSLGERDAAAVRDVLAGLERDVEVTLELGPTATPVTLLAAGGREIDTGFETRRLVEAVCAEFGEGAIVSRMGPLVSQRVRPMAA